MELLACTVPPHGAPPDGRDRAPDLCDEKPAGREPVGCSGKLQGRSTMADEKLKSDDFPVHREQKKIVNNDGKTIAQANDKTVAEDLAERLNAEEDQREQDRWSA
jgi:hypothetical protein